MQCSMGPSLGRTHADIASADDASWLEVTCLSPFVGAVVLLFVLQQASANVKQCDSATAAPAVLCKALQGRGVGLGDFNTRRAAQHTSCCSAVVWDATVLRCNTSGWQPWGCGKRGMHSWCAP